MKVNFDEIVERQGTYSAKWMGANGNSADYRNPDVRLPFQVADMDFACPEPLVQAMHRVADHRIFGYSARTGAYTQAFLAWYRRRYGLELREEWILPSHRPCVDEGGTLTYVRNYAPESRLTDLRRGALRYSDGGRTSYANFAGDG